MTVGRASLVFVHGAGSNRDFWHGQRPAFPEAHYLNLPGHTEACDRSGAGEGIRSVEEYADWVAGYIEARALNSVVLNGHSMGGAIALTLALRRPAWLSAIVLTGTGARLRVLPRLLDLLRVDYPAAVDLIVEQSFARSPGGELTYAQRAHLNGTRRQLLRAPQEVTLGDHEACDRFDVMSQVSEITLPTLCLVGAQDRRTPPKYSEYLHSNIKGSCLEVVEAAGHMLPLEQPEEYNRRLSEFLSAVEGLGKQL
jgi:pimeloyl-ACP methyl ester carboxylesterase